MKFAVPTLNNELTAHFGHCEKFAIIETDNSTIKKEESVTPPVHQPGVYPRFLANMGVDVIIAGGMGQKAQKLFAENNIQVCIGVAEGSPAELVQQYLDNKLTTGQNLCDH
ncbi:MAG: NifB/NifX family molybdenum-iron cluster-binding protein [Bacteroidales bacterium]|jgi:predicted Fe-Mo cluster-binding NifX family protein|nr:NifB/NifX family molybdenum-iron cluster-binding protein [Bacteroidales bacterium]